MVTIKDSKKYTMSLIHEDHVTSTSRFTGRKKSLQPERCSINQIFLDGSLICVWTLEKISLRKFKFSHSWKVRSVCLVFGYRMRCSHLNLHLELLGAMLPTTPTPWLSHCLHCSAFWAAVWHQTPPRLPPTIRFCLTLSIPGVCVHSLCDATWGWVSLYVGKIVGPCSWALGTSIS